MPSLVSKVPLSVVVTGWGRRVSTVWPVTSSTDVAVVAANGERTLIVMVVPANDEVDLVLVEQWQPRFPDTKVRPVSGN